MSTVGTLKLFFEIVLLLSLIGNSNSDLCAKVYGPYFRCVISGSCSFEDQASGPKNCGTGEVGICCRIISSISPQRCGIRSPGMVDDNFKIRSQFRPEEVKIYKESSISESPEMSSDTTLTRQETSFSVENLSQANYSLFTISTEKDSDSVSNSETVFANQILETTTSNADTNEQTKIDSSESTNIDSSESTIIDGGELTNIDRSESTNMDNSEPLMDITSPSEVPTEEDLTITLSIPHHPSSESTITNSGDLTSIDRSESTKVDSSESTNMNNSEPLMDITSPSEVSTEEDLTLSISHHPTTRPTTVPIDDLQTKSTIESVRRKRQIRDINKLPMISNRLYDKKSKSFEENEAVDLMYVENVDTTAHDKFQSDFNQPLQRNVLKNDTSIIVSRTKRGLDWNCSAEDFTSIGGPKTPLEEDILEDNSEESDDLDSRRKAFIPQKIIGGRIEEQPWPWIVAVYNEPTGKFICAGTLFDDKHIISAAHCFTKYYDPAHLVVTIGHLKRLDMATEETNQEKVQLYKVKRIFQHEGFQPHCYCNDVSILRLGSPVESDVIPACIAEKMPATVGQTVTVMGWGYTDNGSTSIEGTRGSHQLQRIDDLIISDSKQCKKILSKVSGIRMPKKFADYYICAGVPSGKKDSCVGDSGGPLMFEDYDGYWTLVGVVSFGYKCGMPGIPATYSKISYYLPWILNVTKTE